MFSSIWHSCSRLAHSSPRHGRMIKFETIEELILQHALRYHVEANSPMILHSHWVRTIRDCWYRSNKECSIPHVFNSAWGGQLNIESVKCTNHLLADKHELHRVGLLAHPHCLKVQKCTFFFEKTVCKIFKQHCEPLSAEVDCLGCGQGEISWILSLKGNTIPTSYMLTTSHRVAPELLLENLGKSMLESLGSHFRALLAPWEPSPASCAAQRPWPKTS
jgi:hypothetical protein